MLPPRPCPSRVEVARAPNPTAGTRGGGAHRALSQQLPTPQRLCGKRNFNHCSQTLGQHRGTRPGRGASPVPRHGAARGTRPLSRAEHGTARNPPPPRHGSLTSRPPPPSPCRYSPALLGPRRRQPTPGREPHRFTRPSAAPPP